MFEVLGLRGNLGGELEFFQLLVAQLLEEIFEPREIFREKFGEQDPRLIKMFLTSFNFFLFFCQAYRFEREKHPFPRIVRSATVFDSRHIPFRIIEERGEISCLMDQ